ncbi:3-methyl-2-oxobutanoate hydroxymethyltransferase [Hydrocarboniphaga daqingensis]|jgi:3-methyl-2-oxobutanoate hydroxymethyltransferase|uniref:3-methyl-2-oxobutanoate hydroxymethyltransferase n=1 Tax=Hydrocarboniphaga daqingensis TaxID=490188 RepID=A0A1M5Q6R0_9GAMM|nr:3-methyl-2-oxobutanoate hydroxymethyltransferase [Hydrocarboniphaga daqingensis]SHH09213.1 3-methyl-2-oxobutanoate hydroxymethyltransferase [Hydrocarboniphaga daqingensis]
MEHDKNSTPSAKPVNIAELRAMRDRGEKIASLTCYDASFAMVQDRAGVDFMLIGDSLGMVIHGGNTTTPVSVDDIVYHSRCVAPHLKRAFLVADLPFLSYATLDRALDSSQRLMQQGGAKMVKLEGGREQASIVEYLAVRGVPVCAHLGLQPQFVHKMGAFKVQGRDDAAAEAMIHDAHVLAEAGADMLLLECIPSELGRRITEASPVPVIGIGAGPHVDGQILVMHDILHISPMVTLGRTPRFVKNFMHGAADIESAFRAYVQDVKSGAYPAPVHCF